MNQLNKLTTRLKQFNQDYEHYPTKPEMLQVIRQHAVRTLKKENFTVLDIGAGRGDAGLVIAGKADVHTIEKSSILREMQPKRCIPISVDFETTTLLDKDHYPVIFCNPPYSQFIQWTEKIIREANAGIIYLVIPERWENNDLIKKIIRTREATYEIIMKDDFLDAERSARAKVDIVAIDLCKLSANQRKDLPDYISTRSEKCNTDPFDQWLQENFSPAPEPDLESIKKAEKELVNAPSFAEALVENYNSELNRLVNFYKTLSKFTLSELSQLIPSSEDTGRISYQTVSGPEQLLKNLKLKIRGLKIKYWKRLFDRYEPLRGKLTSWSSRDLTYKLTGAIPYNSNGCRQTGGRYKEHSDGKLKIDFNLENIHMITAWVCKQCNTDYFNKQAVHMYKEILTYASCEKFKSNKRVFEKENFRWQMYNGEISHVAIKPDVKFILNGRGSCSNQYGSKYKHGLPPNTIDLLNDLRAIARNLGFECLEKAEDKEFSPGKNTEFKYPDGITFMLVKGHKSGTLHIKADPRFLKAWTILVSRLEGWIKSQEEFSKEVPKYSLKEINKYWKSNYQIINTKLLQ